MRENDGRSRRGGTATDGCAARLAVRGSRRASSLLWAVFVSSPCPLACCLVPAFTSPELAVRLDSLRRLHDPSADVRGVSTCYAVSGTHIARAAAPGGVERGTLLPYCPLHCPRILLYFPMRYPRLLPYGPMRCPVLSADAPSQEIEGLGKKLEGGLKEVDGMKVCSPSCLRAVRY
eukprot:291070-Rhodomonas_salina.1